MKLTTVAEMQNIDYKAIKNYGIPGIVLMENAALNVVKKAKQILISVEGKKILVFCGVGNNGGDGFAVARHLINQGADVKVFLLGSDVDVKADAAINLKILQLMGVKIHQILDEKDLYRIDISLSYTQLVIDAIYGTGFKGVNSGIIAQLIRLINKNNRLVLSIDLPSGMDPDTGEVREECIKATHTVTLGLAKLGLFLEPACRFVGALEVVDISLPKVLLNDASIKRQLITTEWAKSKFLKRDANAHKGTFGHVLIIGGSPGMTGAVCLAAMGALRAGSGLVTIAMPNSLNSIVEQKLTEVMTKPLPENSRGFLGFDAIEPILEISQKMDIIAIGPGMGISEEGEAFLSELLKRIKKPIVLDADGLKLLGKIIDKTPDFIASLSSEIILTPHPGEMAALISIKTEEIQKNRLKIAEAYAKKWGVNIVLKGSKTIVASANGRTYLNVTGNVGMSTGGTGDILTGIIASFMGQGMNIHTAAALGVFVHGLAGDKAVEEMGKYSLIAGDILDYLPRVLLELTD